MRYDALYSRQSVEKKDSISIENQLEYCKYETHGDPYIEYADRGFSGKNTNRPDFARMMDDIRAGKIKRVIVYKLDRISRSILDFANMMELFQKYDVEFVSSTEKFDTSSPIGRAMLNICIVFAQLERETIQKRVADAYLSRSSKGFYMGGRIPFGFKKVPCVINGIHTSKYEENPEESSQVKLIYELYSDFSTSLGDVVAKLKELGQIHYGNPWTRSRIRDVLINPVYVRANLDVYNFFKEQGVSVQNDPSDFIGINGCYYYRGQNKSRRKYTNMEGSNLVIAPHEGFIDPDIWLKCRRKCLSNQSFAFTTKAKHTWLAGKIKCGKCGYALLAKCCNHRPTKYLLCSNRYNAKSCEGAGKLILEDVEQIVFNEMKKKLGEFKVLSKEDNRGENPTRRKLILEQANIENEMNILLDKIASSDETLFRYINEKITALEEKKRAIEQKLTSLENSSQISVTKIEDYVDKWDDLSFEDKRAVTDAMITKISATSEKIQINWRI